MLQDKTIKTLEKELTKIKRSRVRDKFHVFATIAANLLVILEFCAFFYSNMDFTDGVIFLDYLPKIRDSLYFFSIEYVDFWKTVVFSLVFPIVLHRAVIFMGAIISLLFSERVVKENAAAAGKKFYEYSQTSLYFMSKILYFDPCIEYSVPLAIAFAVIGFIFGGIILYLSGRHYIYFVLLLLYWLFMGAVSCIFFIVYNFLLLLYFPATCNKPDEKFAYRLWESVDYAGASKEMEKLRKEEIKERTTDGTGISSSSFSGYSDKARNFEPSSLNRTMWTDSQTGQPLYYDGEGGMCTSDGEKVGWSRMS